MVKICTADASVSTFPPRTSRTILHLVFTRARFDPMTATVDLQPTLDAARGTMAGLLTVPDRHRTVEAIRTDVAMPNRATTGDEGPRLLADPGGHLALEEVAAPGTRARQVQGVVVTGTMPTGTREFHLLEADSGATLTARLVTRWTESDTDCAPV